MLEPFFCARASASAAAHLGPYVRLPAAARRLAAALLHYLPVTPELLEALCRCAHRRPAAAPPLLAAVEAAVRRGAVARGDAISFALTLALVAAAETGAADGAAADDDEADEEAAADDDADGAADAVDDDDDDDAAARRRLWRAAAGAARRLAAADEAAGAALRAFCAGAGEEGARLLAEVSEDAGVIS